MTTCIKASQVILIGYLVFLLGRKLWSVNWNTYEFHNLTNDAILTPIFTHMGVVTISPFVMLILLAIILGFGFQPLVSIRERWTREADIKRQTMEPIKRNINSQHKGERAHQLLIEAYQENEISIFFSAKPIIPLLLQIPLIIAVFSALAESTYLGNLNMGAGMLNIYGIPIDLLEFNIEPQYLYVTVISALYFVAYQYFKNERRLRFKHLSLSGAFCLILSCFPVFITVFTLSFLLSASLVTIFLKHKF